MYFLKIKQNKDLEFIKMLTITITNGSSNQCDYILNPNMQIHDQV